MITNEDTMALYFNQPLADIVKLQYLQRRALNGTGTEKLAIVADGEHIATCTNLGRIGWTCQIHTKSWAEGLHAMTLSDCVTQTLYAVNEICAKFAFDP